MKTFTLLALASAATVVSAATVKLEQTPCLQSNYELKSFDVTIGSLFVKDLPTTCGLKMVSANDTDVSKINCQAYKDAAGTQKGSTVFNYTSPALIATNPVQIGSCKCENGSLGTNPMTTLTASPTGSAPSSATPIGSGANSTVPTAGNGTNPAATNTPSQPSGSGSPNGAERLGLSLGVVAAGLVVFML